jgi:predicted O-methyltransferase YrrM
MPTTTPGRLERARETAATIEGWLSDREGELLFQLAARCPPGMPIVEIGSWKGKSTVWLAAGIQDPAVTQLFAIDPHQRSLEDPTARTLDDLKANLARAGVADAVVPIESTSHAAASAFVEKPGLVFVDGSHIEEAVQVDLDDWLPKLVDGGVIAMHDILNHRWSGPRRALRRLLWRSRQITGVQFADSIAWMTKVDGNTSRDRRHNQAMAVLLVCYEMKSLPEPLLRLLRAVYRHTPLKRR